MITGAVANPFMKPLELNMIRLSQKVEAGAEFHPDPGGFQH